ncbi:hypothetical protein RND81_04G092300 [Saponaria officinalis]|uniref:Glycine-rich protein n=1 Tax=Saponaria officinalis TaxID=3572 RepID=A0AAW1LK58_SAPOF
MLAPRWLLLCLVLLAPFLVVLRVRIEFALGDGSDGIDCGGGEWWVTGWMVVGGRGSGRGEFRDRLWWRRFMAGVVAARGGGEWWRNVVALNGGRQIMSEVGGWGREIMDGGGWRKRER